MKPAWFLEMLGKAVGQAHEDIGAVLHKARFWRSVQGTCLNARQVKVFNRLLDGFDGKLTSSIWAALAKCSSDTALRDISDLVDRGILQKMGREAAARAMNSRLSSCIPPGQLPWPERPIASHSAKGTGSCSSNW